MPGYLAPALPTLNALHALGHLLPDLGDQGMASECPGALPKRALRAPDRRYITCPRAAVGADLLPQVPWDDVPCDLDSVLAEVAQLEVVAQDAAAPLPAALVGEAGARGLAVYCVWLVRVVLMRAAAAASLPPGPCCHQAP
jgi:hypothetical protein